MTNGISSNSSVDFTQLLEQAKKKNEEKQAQEAQYQGSIWGKTESATGIDMRNLGTNFNIFESGKSWGDEVGELGSGVGQVAFAPIKLGVGILGGAFKLLGGIFGGIGGAQGPQGPQGQQPPQQPSAPASPANGGSTKTTSTGSTSGSEKSGETKKSDSTASTGANEKAGSVKTTFNTSTYKNERTLSTTSEKVSSYSRAMVEEYNDSTDDLTKLNSELTKAEAEEKELKTKGATENAKSAALAKVKEFDNAITSYTNEFNSVSGDIQAQEQLLNECKDDTEKARIQSTIYGLKRQADEIKAAIADAKAQKEAAQTEADNADGTVARDGSNDDKLAKVQAKIASLKQQITTAENRQKIAKEEVEKAEKEAQENIENTPEGAAKAAEHQKEVNKKLDGYENDAIKVTKDQLLKDIDTKPREDASSNVSGGGNTPQMRTTSSGSENADTITTEDGTRYKKNENGEYVDDKGNLADDITINGNYYKNGMLAAD